MTVVVSAQPLVIDALLTLAEASKGSDGGLDPKVTVSDGPGADGNPGDRLIIGGDGPDDVDLGAVFAAASGSQEWAYATSTKRKEDGDVLCTAMSWNGDGDVKKARDAVFAMAGALVNIVVDDYTLGLVVLLWAAFGGQLALSYQTDTQGGVTAVLVFQIHFKSRI